MQVVKVNWDQEAHGWGLSQVDVKSIDIQSFTFTEFFYRCSAAFQQVEYSADKEPHMADRLAQ